MQSISLAVGNRFFDLTIFFFTIFEGIYENKLKEPGLKILITGEGERDPNRYFQDQADFHNKKIAENVNLRKLISIRDIPLEESGRQLPFDN